MNFIAAHKIALLLGLALTGAAIYFLRKRAGGGGSSAGVAGAPYDNGVPISPYSDSSAPQFSFDFGSLLGGGQPTTPGGSSAPPPNGVPTTPAPLPSGSGAPPTKSSTHPFPLDSNVQQLLRGSHPISNPTVSLPISQPFGSSTAYVPRGGAFVAS